MAQPSLLHPISVWLEPIDRTRTAVMDEVLKEPIGQVERKKTIKLVAQQAVGIDDAARAEGGAFVMDADGYMLFRTADLRSARVTIAIGDRIVKIGEKPNQRETDLYIGKLKWTGHYPDQGGPTLLKAFYADRAPSRQRGDL